MIMIFCQKLYTGDMSQMPSTAVPTLYTLFTFTLLLFSFHCLKSFLFPFSSRRQTFWQIYYLLFFYLNIGFFISITARTKCIDFLIPFVIVEDTYRRIHKTPTFLATCDSISLSERFVHRRNSCEKKAKNTYLCIYVYVCVQSRFNSVIGAL